MKFFAYILIFTALFLNIPQSVGAEENNPGEKDIIRVGLSNSGFSTFEFSEISILTTDKSTVTDMASGAEIKDISANSEIFTEIKNGEFYVNINGLKELKNLKGPVVIMSNGKIGVKNLTRKGNPAYYKGMMELKAVSGNREKFNIINVLDLQTYLKGVVPNEMPVSFGLNALKAQAVAARNYANRPQNVYKNYDICDSTACQVYYGANSENPLSDRAVDETEGIFALYNEKPILALYSSTGGGITEDYDSVYGNGNILAMGQKPYLKSVKDNDSLKIPKTEEELKAFYTENVPSFDIKSPKHRWKVEFNRFELEEILTKTLYEQSAKSLVYPMFSATSKVEGLEDIKVTKRGVSGKAIEVEIRAMSGNWLVKKELGIRRVFKKGKSILWSGNFVIEKKFPEILKQEVINNDINISNNTNNISSNIEKADTVNVLGDTIPKKPGNRAIFTFENPENQGAILPETKLSHEEDIKKIYKNAFGEPLPETFTFIGAGFGHGVGMSQYGAGYLAAQGVGYDAILKHYYRGIKLGTMKRGVQYNNYNQNYVQTLYFNKENPVTAGNLSPSIKQNPLNNEIMALYDISNTPGKYILNIDNSKRPTELEFYINDFHFSPDMRGFWGKVLKMDITKYLKTGRNTIKFLPLKQADKDKTVYYWVEIEK